MSHRLENVGVTDGGRLFHALGGNEQLGTIDFSFDLVPAARHVRLARTQPDIADEQVADYLGGLLAILPQTTVIVFPCGASLTDLSGTAVKGSSMRRQRPTASAVAAADFPSKLTVSLAPGSEVPHPGIWIFCRSTALSQNGWTNTGSSVGGGSASDGLIARQIPAMVEERVWMK